MPTQASTKKNTFHIGNSVSKLSGLAADGELVRLRDFQGKYLVIYFYPKDQTPGCTRQALDFRDLYSEFESRNTAVIGVSRDSLKSHQNFQRKQELPFPLIADTEEVWCQAFGVIQEKQLYGRRYIGLVRSTFLIDPKGKLCHEWRNVKVPGHVKSVLDYLDTLAP